MMLRFLALSMLALAAIACSDGSRGGGGGDDDDDDGAGGSGGVGVGGGGPGAGGTSTCTPTDGDFFMALSVSQSPTSPIVFLAALQFGSDGMHASLQPLAASDRQTPVGAPIDAPPSGQAGYPVGPDGDFSADIAGVIVPAEANSISSTEIVADVTLSGTICADSGCGTVGGAVTQPIMLDLTGSTFTMERVTGPDDYPEPPKINCTGDLASPLAP
jgi:hypothetical protein